jgi:DNA-binding transcriptional ArsR family regulator
VIANASTRNGNDPHPLDALGDPTRRAIFDLLRQGEMSVGEIADRLPVSRPAVSQHLKVLTDARLVTHERNGTRNLYRLAPDGLSDLRSWLEEFWSDALAQLKEVAEGHSTSKSGRRKT